MNLLHHLVEEATSKAHQYQVNPTIFVALYALHYLLLWPTVGYIVFLFNKKRPYMGLIPLALFFLIMPWFYPLFFGKLPWYFDTLLVGFMIFVVWHGYHNIQHRLHREKAKAASPTPDDAAWPPAPKEMAAEES